MQDKKQFDVSVQLSYLYNIVLLIFDVLLIIINVLHFHWVIYDTFNEVFMANIFENAVKFNEFI